jgi:hypothetical protein
MINNNPMITLKIERLVSVLIVMIFIAPVRSLVERNDRMITKHVPDTCIDFVLPLTARYEYNNNNNNNNDERLTLLISTVKRNVVTTKKV